MLEEDVVGSYVLDTLQIYFSWDDDLYTYIKDRGFGQSGFSRKTLPLVYSDNCLNNSGLKERRRKYVIDPAYFGKTHEQIGWVKTDKVSEPIIPAEKPELLVSLLGENLKLEVIPKTNGREQYHLEYSTMAAFGRLYSNWAIPVLTDGDFKSLIVSLEKKINVRAQDVDKVWLKVEEKQAQRELMHFAEVPLVSYKFSMGQFAYAKDFLAMNGYKGIAPSLVFKDEPAYLQKMEPVLKVGFIQTNSDQGFENRKPQIALKVSQPKMTESLRGKRSKIKGFITEEEDFENYFVVPAKEFVCAAKALVGKHCL